MDFKLYAFVYNYSNVKLLRTPLLGDPVHTYATMSRKKQHFNLVHMDYDICEINTETAKHG